MFPRLLHIAIVCAGMAHKPATRTSCSIAGSSEAPSFTAPQPMAVSWVPGPTAGRGVPAGNGRSARNVSWAPGPGVAPYWCCQKGC